MKKESGIYGFILLAVLLGWLLLEWMKKYKAHKIESNYINYHNNRKKIIKEVLITNY